MSKSKDRGESSEIKKIKNFIESLGYRGISHPSSQNQIYLKNDNVIIIRADGFKRNRRFKR